MINEITNRVSGEKRSVLRRLEELLPEIEDGLAKGYSHTVMHAALPALGIDISLPYYHRALRILRAERRAKQELAQATPPDVPDPAPTPKLGQQLRPQPQQRLQSRPETQPPEFVGEIANVESGPKPFKWKGEDLLTKDWTHF